MEVLFYTIIIGMSVYSGYRCHRVTEKKKRQQQRHAQRQELLFRLQEVKSKRKRYSIKND